MKKIFFGLFFLVLLFLFAELMARAYYYRKSADSRLAILELVRSIKHSLFDKEKIDNSNHYIVRPGLSKAENDSIAAESRRSNYYVYRPWVEFTYGNIHGKYVNAFEQVRKSIPEISGSGSDTMIIWFLGGSTMFGYNLTDGETIPSAFVREYQKRGGRPIKVVNYGTPSFFSYQELILLADNIFRGKIPDIVIMLDGLNEGIAAFASYYRYPWNAAKLQKLLNPELFHYSKNYDYYHFPDSNKIGEVSQKIFENYMWNIASVKKLSEIYHFQLYCFWQPVPFFDYPNQSKDPFCAKTPVYQFNYLCPQVKSEADELGYLFYLGDMLKSAQLPFIDSGNYTPSLCDSIACRMLDKIFSQRLPS